MTVAEEAVEDLADLFRAAREVRSVASRELLERVAARRANVRPGVSKAGAARLLGVSVPTIDKWIDRGRLPVVRDEASGRTLLPLAPLAAVYAHVKELRAAGADRGVLAQAISDLERRDPQYQREFEGLYGAAIASANDGRLVPLVVPDSFGPDD